MTDQSTIIRNATIDDLPGILEIYNHAIINTTAVYSEQPHTLDMRVAWYNDRISSGRAIRWTVIPPARIAVISWVRVNAPRQKSVEKRTAKPITREIKSGAL